MDGVGVNLRQSGFCVPGAAQAHAYLWLRLSNSDHPDVINSGEQLYQLRRIRNKADYDFRKPVEEATVVYQVQVATDIVQLLDTLAKEEAILAQVIEAIKVYERDVLREVTWRP